MGAKTVKIDKYFVLSDSSVNCYGFRLLTGGFQLAEFEKNPIGYLMHDRECGVLVRWEDLKIENDQLLGKPVINLSNEKGQQVVDEINNGFLNAASVGHLVILDYSDDDIYKLPTQDGPTGTKWFCRECSIVDVPGNYNSLRLYDKDEKAITLEQFKLSAKNQTNQKMSKLLLSGLMLQALALQATATESEMENAFADLVGKAKRSDELKADLDKKNLEVSNLKAEIELTKATHEDAKVNEMTDKALAEKRITKALADKLKIQYKGKSVELKAILDELPVYMPITSQLGAGTSGNEWEKKTWQELFESGELAAVKEKNPELYKAKFVEKFGKEPSN